MPNLSLANYWHPIATSEEVVEQPKAFVLLGERLVAFRGAEGVSVFKDLAFIEGPPSQAVRSKTVDLSVPITDGHTTAAVSAYIFPRFHQTRRYRGAPAQFRTLRARPTALSGSR